MLCLLLMGWWGSNWYIVEGVVVAVPSERRVVVEHEEIAGFMDAMTMPFTVRDPALIADLQPGDQIVGRLVVDKQGSYLARIRVTGHGPVPGAEEPTEGGNPVRPGRPHPPIDVDGADGAEIRIGEGQIRPIALTYVYTTCPMPEFCPAIVARLALLQEKLAPGDARIVAVTLDPKVDTAEVLTDYAKVVGADPALWSFARARGEDLTQMAFLASMRVDRESGTILHTTRMLVLDAQGNLIERYDDVNWSVDRVAQQLKTGGPRAPRGSHGTLTPEDESAATPPTP